MAVITGEEFSSFGEHIRGSIGEADSKYEGISFIERLVNSVIDNTKYEAPMERAITIGGKVGVRQFRVDAAASIRNEYIDAALKNVTTLQIGENEYFSKIRELNGLWGYGNSPEQARKELEDTIHDWITIRNNMGSALPLIDSEAPFELTTCIAAK